MCYHYDSALSSDKDKKSDNIPKIPLSRERLSLRQVLCLGACNQFWKHNYYYKRLVFKNFETDVHQLYISCTFNLSWDVKRGAFGLFSPSNTVFLLVISCNMWSNTGLWLEERRQSSNGVSSSEEIGSSISIVFYSKTVYFQNFWKPEKSF